MQPSKTQLFGYLMMEYDLNAMIYQPCFLKIDEVAYVDKGRNLAVALGERDVKVRSRDVFCFDLFFVKISASILCEYRLKWKMFQADVKAKNKRERKVCNNQLDYYHPHSSLLEP